MNTPKSRFTCKTLELLSFSDSHVLSFRTSPTSSPTVDDAAVQRAVEEVAAAVAHQETEPQMNHARAHDFGHGEAVSLILTGEFAENFESFFSFLRAFQFVVRFTDQVDVKDETFTSQWHSLVLH